ELVKETNAIFTQSPLNFVGNVEGGDIFKGKATVVVCEGFVGNVVLKTAEGLSESLVTLFKRLLGERPPSSPANSGGAGMREFAAAFADRLDYASVGCAPLLGVNGISMIAHGRSSARAIQSSIGTTRRAIEGRINDKIQDGLAQFTGA
ncbi:MAG: phosphate--acyl-ACP acyltransferase, partial [Planctomycetes bacterium]|nr:phosphate--acyl-ACP acyltransferase [Planctomycetota bacterium]